MARLTTVEAACCVGQKCETGGMPANCDLACAGEFLPFYSDCGSLLDGLDPSTFGPFASQCRAASQTQAHGCGFQEFFAAATSCTALMDANAPIPGNFCTSPCYSSISPFLDACEGSLDEAVQAVLDAGTLVQAAASCQQISVIHTTASGEQQLCTSGVSCQDLGWGVDSAAASDSQTVCGSSEAGIAGGCTTSQGWDHARSVCVGAGARLCTLSELQAGETRGSGCGFDLARAWSSTSANCPPGQHMSTKGSPTDGDGNNPDAEQDGSQQNAGYGGEGAAMLPRCDPDDTPNVVRCCADAVITANNGMASTGHDCDVSCQGLSFTMDSPRKAGMQVCGASADSTSGEECGFSAPYVGLATFGCSDDVNFWGGNCCNQNSCDGGGAHCTKADCSMDDIAAECGDFVRRNGMTWSLSGDATDLNAGSTNPVCGSPCQTRLEQAVEECDETDAASVVDSIHNICRQPECAAASAVFLASVGAVCCSNADCSGGVPTECTPACAEVFVPVYGQCGSTLWSSSPHEMQDTMSVFEQLCTGSDADQINLALGQPTASSALWSAETASSNANDGDRDHSYPNLFHSDGPDNFAWWAVKLDSVVTDPIVRVWARDCCTVDFGNMLHIKIATGEATDGWMAGDACATLTGVTDSSTTDVECVGTGNVIIIWASGWLEMAEVQVFANPAASRSSDPIDWSVHSDLLSWQNAENSCALQGGHLASLHSRAEQRAVDHLLEAPTWIGLNDIAQEAGCDGDSFVWSDGSDNDWSRWADGEPNEWTGDAASCDNPDDSSRACQGSTRPSCDYGGNVQANGVGGEDCVEDIPHGKTSQWGDAGCSVQKQYVCHDTTPAQQTIVQHAFVIYEFGESVYPQIGGASFDDAEAACAQSGRRLASIHNSDQAQALQALLAQHTDIQAALIGLQDRGQFECGMDGDCFAWSDGTPLDYTAWNPGEPNDWGSGDGSNPAGEDCTAVSNPAFIPDSSQPPHDTGVGWNDVTCGGDLATFGWQTQGKIAAVCGPIGGWEGMRPADLQSMNMDDCEDDCAFNCAVFPASYHGQTMQVGNDGWAHWPNLGLYGHDHETKTTAKMSVDQAKRYCVNHAWCVGFSYSVAAGTVYFKDQGPTANDPSADSPDGQLGQWGNSGGDSGLYLMCPTTGTNLALNRPAIASSTWTSETTPGKAVDGDDSRHFPDIFHSAGPGLEWWSVELVREVSSPTVRLMMRDCCMDNSPTLMVYMDASAVTAEGATAATDAVSSGAAAASGVTTSVFGALCGSLSNQLAGGTYDVSCSAAPAGKWVSVLTQGFLQLAEVQVFVSGSDRFARAQGGGPGGGH